MEPTIIKFVTDPSTGTVRCDHFDVTISCKLAHIADINCSENNIFIIDGSTLYAYDMNGVNTHRVELFGDELFISTVLSGFVYIVDASNDAYSFVYDEELNYVQQLTKREPLVISYKESMLTMDVLTKKIIDEFGEDEEVDIADAVRDIFEEGGVWHKGYLHKPLYVDDEYIYFRVENGLVRRHHSDQMHVEFVESCSKNNYFVVKPPASKLKFSD